LPEADLALLERAARSAGELASRFVGRHGEVREKPGGHGPVSAADLAVDDLLREELRGARPGYGWLSEESEDGPARLGAARVFVVDPIDGTRAFVAGEKAWAIALAVVEAGQPVAAVVHLPLLDRTYVAARRQGARLNGTTLAASVRGELAGARVLVAKNQLAPEHWPGGVPAVARGFRPSLAYRVCLVAEGEADATLTFRDTWEWDLAAASLVASEAGAVVTDRRGEPLAFNNPVPMLPGLIAAGAPLHAAILERL
jgi:myo-inositol-1(or 4)-monophosphatase